MANIFSDATMELEELFASDKSNMRKRHIELAERDYEKLKQVGYVRTPSELDHSAQTVPLVSLK